MRCKSVWLSLFIQIVPTASAFGMGGEWEWVAVAADAAKGMRLLLFV